LLSKVIQELVDLRGLQVPQDLREPQDPKAIQGLRGLQVPQDLREPQDPKAIQDLRERQDHREIRDRVYPF
jgi:hypothetical protein